MVSQTVTGDRALIRKLLLLGASAPDVVGGGLFEHGERVLAESKEKYVPVDQGALRASGHVEPPVIRGTMASVDVGFGGPSAPYALSVHENPRAGKTGGVSPRGKKYRTWATVGEWKFLETPMKLLANLLPKVIAQRVEREIQRRAAG